MSLTLKQKRLLYGADKPKPLTWVYGFELVTGDKVKFKRKNITSMRQCKEYFLCIVTDGAESKKVVCRHNPIICNKHFESVIQRQLNDFWTDIVNEFLNKDEAGQYLESYW